MQSIDAQARASAPRNSASDSFGAALRRPQSSRRWADVIPLDIRLGLLRQYGNFGYAYAVAFEPNNQHYGDERGFLSFKMTGSTALVLADPIAPAHYRRELIARFIAEKRDVCFWAASRSTAEILGSLGLFINEMGPENRIELDAYDFSGNHKRSLRQAINRTAKLGYATRECSFAALDPDQVRGISEAWRQTRTVRAREITFLNRPIVYEDEIDVRKFFTFDRDGNMMAFSFFDPVYENGRIVGYMNNIKRRLPAADPLVSNALTCHAIAKFREEGLRWLLLGLAPFAGLQRTDASVFKDTWWVYRCFKSAYQVRLLNRIVFPSRSVNAHKRQFCPVTEQTYYASTRRSGLLRILKVLRACSIV